MQVRATIKLLAVALFLFPLFTIPSPEAAAGDSSQKTNQLIVVELFTSQGCSSCPPADAYLHELAEMDGVLPLSMHVDYWDYIGWKDPFAMPKVGERQREYAAHFGLRYVYTPQAVVHGIDQATGSDRRAVGRAIARLRGKHQVPIELVKTADGGMAINLPDDPTVEHRARITMVVFDREHQTAIKRGENRGRTIKYRNVVRGFRPIAQWNGRAASVPLSARELASMQGESCVIIVQSMRTGHILGAAAMPLHN